MGRAALRGSLGCLLMLACRGTCAPPEVALLEQVEVSGCAAWSSDRRCLAAPGQDLVFWVRTRGPVTLFVGDELVTDTRTVHGGARFRWPRPDAPGPVELRAATEAGQDRWRFRVEAPPSSDALDRARAAREAGTASVAHAALDEIRAAAPPWVRLQAAIEGARLAARRGDGAATARRRREAIRIAARAGLTSMVRDQNLALAHTLLFVQGDLEGARRAFDAAEAAGPATAGQAVLGFTRGFLAQEVQDSRAALAAFQDTIVWAERFDQPGLARSAELTRVMTFAELGRFDEAWRALERVLGDPSAADDPCTRAYAYQNRGWIALRAAQAQFDLPNPNPDEDIAAAIRLYRGACPRPEQLPSLWLNRALAALIAKRPAQARRALDEARASSKDLPLLLELWRLDLEGQLELEQRAPAKAQAAFEQLRGLAQRAVARDASWRAELGLARTASLRGDLAEAEASFERAERKLDRLVAATGLTQGRGGLVANRRVATEAHIELLLRLGQTARALEVHRRTRARLLRGLHRDRRVAALDPAARLRWQENLLAYRRLRTQLDETTSAQWRTQEEDLQPKLQAMREELERRFDAAMRAVAEEPAAPSETPKPTRGLTLTYAELGAGWVAFASSPAGVRAHRQAGAPSRSRALLAPFEAELSTTKRVRLVVSGRFVEMDLHAAPWSDGPLAASHEVVYAVDVPAPVRPARGPLLLVVDPRGDLPGARDEGRVVRAARPDAEVLSGTRASATALREALGRAGALHYAGHGVYRGREGWESVLPLADGAALSVQDVLALPRAPASVVLTGCETARSDARPAATMGLAQAFVLAGAEVVVAAARPVEDEIALALTRALYRAPSRDLVSDLHAALRTLRESHPDADWAAFRAVVP